jgi:hypothetical protein
MCYNIIATTNHKSTYVDMLIYRVINSFANFVAM